MPKKTIEEHVEAAIADLKAEAAEDKKNRNDTFEMFKKAFYAYQDADNGPPDSIVNGITNILKASSEATINVSKQIASMMQLLKDDSKNQGDKSLKQLITEISEKTENKDDK